jgi:NAD(P)-dependent dehydrogenase (short-subunit alcohol dehydrogenase family)
MNLGLSGKTVLITGGSKGIGLSCAAAFLDEGCTVTLVSRSTPQLEAARDQLQAHLHGQDRVRILPADLASGPERERLFATLPDTDILINNAGAIPAGGLLDISMETWEQAWSLKVMGYIHLTQLFLTAMKARNSGIICNIIGSAGRNPRYDYICGAAGNAALIAFTGAIGAKAADWGVRIFGINPAATRTDRITILSQKRALEKFGDETRWPEMLTSLPLGRLIEPDEIARAAAFLASPACGYVSGTVLDIDGGGSYRG